MIISIGNLPLKNIQADIFMHPIRWDDKTITYEPMAEEAVIALIAKHFTYDVVTEDIKNYFDEMDDGYLFSESNFDEFDLEKLDKGEILIGKDIYLHPKVENIKNFLFLLQKYSNFKISGIDLSNFNISNLEEIEHLPSFDGSIVYECNDLDLIKKDVLICSQQFIIANKIKSPEVLVIDEKKKVIKNDKLKGTFGIIFGDNKDYPFKKVKISNI